MLPVEAKPLLAEEHGSSATSPAETLASSGRRGGSMGSTRISISREWGSSPSADELAQSSYTDLVSLAKSASAENATPPGSASRNQLGTINGVYVPCLLNIIGVILFLRLGWGVGQAGVEGMLLIFFMAELQAVLTVLSASTIASNGSMQGGGSYFLISRSLGPEFGGAIGLQFYFLYAVGVSMYLVGFAEEAQQTWIPDPDLGKRWVVVIIATAALLAILIIGLIGANAFAKINKYLFLLQFACVAIGALFIFVLKPHALKSGGEFTGVRMETLKANLEPDFTPEQSVCGDGVACTLAGVYAIVFPLATGFMEGLNLSGDLKEPGRSIPVGTLAAVGTSCVIYIFLIITFAAAFTGTTLRNNFTFFQEVSSFPYVVIAGVLVSCFSSGLGALFGASRILQAIARDDLFPLLSSMAQGSAHGDEPQNAVVFTALLTQVFIFLGDLDVIAPICTSFFCLAYAGVNLTCFLLQVTGVPNFRPTFRYHTWHLSLLGVALNVAVMIYLNPLYAVVSLIILTALFFYLYLTVAPKNWGDISQALIYHQVRKYLLRLDTRKAHSKFWRPSILLLTSEITCPEVRLCHSLKKGGLYVIGNVITGDFSFSKNNKCSETYSQWLGHIFDAKMKAIPLVVAATNAREGYRMLMQTSGLGGMQVNTVVIPWTSISDPRLGATQISNSLDLSSAEDFVGLLIDGIVIKKNVVVTRHVHRLDARLLSKKSKTLVGELSAPVVETSDRGTETIDVWVTGSWDTSGVNSSAALMLQLAYILHSNKHWRRRTRIRLIKACTSSNPIVMHQERLRLGQTATALRVDEFVDEILVISINASSILAESASLQRTTANAHYFDEEKSIIELNQTLQRNSPRTAQVVLMLPDPRLHAAMSLDEVTAASQLYVAKLELLTNNLPSTMLIFSDDEAAPVVSTSI